MVGMVFSSDGATFDSIGVVLSTMKTCLNPFLNNSGLYRGQNLTGGEHTREIRSVDAKF